MKEKWYKFISGFLFYSAITSLWQDMLGKEAYIELAYQKWIPASKTVPMAIILLIISMYLFVNDNK